jgi:hypothetical protein
MCNILLSSAICISLRVDEKLLFLSYCVKIISDLIELAMYRICIVSALDKKWSDYYGGMKIENVNDPKRFTMTILKGQLADQCVLKVSSMSSLT